MNKINNLLKPRPLIGVIAIVAALMMILENFGISIIGKVLGIWPLALVVLGAAMLNNDNNNKDLFRPILLISLGVFLMLAKYGIFSPAWYKYLIPLGLILVGAYLINPKLHRTQSNDQTKSIDIFSVLSGGNFDTRSSKLNGGNVTCILGGADIDIRDADMEDDSMVIDVILFMGGADIKVPAHWAVKLQVFPFLGGVSNKTTSIADKIDTPKKTLIVKGIAIMGGIEIKN